MNFSEKDWKLFKKRIGDWQESYIEQMNHRYLSILNEPLPESEKFWKLEKNINNDKKKWV